MQAYITTKDELHKSIAEAVEQTVAKRVPGMIREATRKEYFTLSEACEFLNCTRRHLQYLRDSGQINWIQNGRKIYFRYEDLRRFMDDNYVEVEQKESA